MVIDADDSQQSLLSKRNLEKEEGLYSEAEEPYMLMGSLSAQVPELLENFSDLYDIIMVDLPGNLKQKGVLSTYALADVLLIPAKADFLNLNSLVRFIEILKEDVAPFQKENNLNTKIGVFLNNVNPRSIEVKELLNTKENYKSSFYLFDNIIPTSDVTFGREFNTYSDYENDRNQPKYNLFIEELISFIN